jgi:basic membrane protein A
MRSFAARCAVVGLAVSVAVTLLVPQALSAGKDTIKAAFVYVGPVSDMGWTYGHDEGRKAAEKAIPGLTTAYIENVPEGADAERVIETFAQKGFDAVFTTSFGFMDATAAVAKKYPQIQFFHCSGFKRGENLSTYFGKMEQAKYLAGLIAGKMTKSGKIGFVAPHPIPEVVRFTNAFTLGVREVNPKATVKVVWTRSWYAPDQEKEAALSLVDAGCDIIATGCDSPAAVKAAEERGKLAIGYDSDASAIAPKAYLTAPIWHWGVYYTKVLSELKAGTWKARDDWWGIETGICGLGKFGPMIPKDVLALVSTRTAEIASGKRIVFAGPLKDQSGAVKVPEGKVPSDQDLLSMLWFVEGIEGTIPK